MTDSTIVETQPPVGVGTTEEAPAVGNELTLEEINKTLGKDFKDKETALKSLADTNSYVGKLSSDLATLREQSKSNPADSGLAEKITKLENKLLIDEFYSSNKDYNIPGVKKILGNNPAEAIKDSELKAAADAIVANAKAENSKSVLHSNPRLGLVRDKQIEAREQVSKGDYKGAAANAVGSVIEAYEN